MIEEDSEVAENHLAVLHLEIGKDLGGSRHRGDCEKERTEDGTIHDGADNKNPIVEIANQPITQGSI